MFFDKAPEEEPIYGFALHPVFFVSFLLMAANDLFLKPSGLCPAAAGKLSDLAIVLFLPAVAALGFVWLKYCASGIAGLRLDPRLTRTDAAVCVIAVDAVLAAINLSETFRSSFAAFMNGINVLRPLVPVLGATRDPTDLVVLPASLAAYFLLEKESRRLISFSFSRLRTFRSHPSFCRDHFREARSSGRGGER